MLRDYQIEMKTRLMEAWKAHRSVMVQMPTGTGKTHLLASVVSEFVSSAGRYLLLLQRAMHASSFGPLCHRY
jgi:superfamily II DNA or RNA helicase